uniref:Uncharacterized protein n=2 Tax=Anguilla anguilla TaxID=7936 RepID=A0A0E9VRX4_ANGAN
MRGNGKGMARHWRLVGESYVMADYNTPRESLTALFGQSTTPRVFRQYPTARTG